MRLLPAIYKVLLYAYPRDFRRRYGREMALVFADRAKLAAQTGGLTAFAFHALGDWITSALRERVTAQPTRQPVHGTPMFYSGEGDTPHWGALMNGAILSLLVFFGISFTISHIKGRPWKSVGSYNRSFSHMLPVPAATPTTMPDTETKVRPEPAPPRVSAYFRQLALLGALDTDGDGVLSAAEIANASVALMKLDKNHDKKLSPEECGFGPLQEEHSARWTERARLTFMRLHPVLAAMDTDHNGELSALEILNAPAALRTLDLNADGSLTDEEIAPNPLFNQFVMILSALDTDGDGKISPQEQTGSIAQHYRGLLRQADRNHDGIVTEQELARALGIR